MKLKTVPLVLVLLALASAGAMAAEKKPVTVAVFDFAPIGQANRDIADQVTALITADLSMSKELVTLERVALSKTLAEGALGLSGVVTADAAAKVGQLTGAKILVTGQVFKDGPDRVVIVPKIIGAETSRVYSPTIEGSSASITKLAAQVSRKIEETILDHSTNLVVVVESREERIARIAKTAKPGNHPTIAFRVADSTTKNHVQTRTVNNELAYIFQKAGFTVVDDKAEHKPEVIVSGSAAYDVQEGRHGLTTAKASVVITVQERMSGKILVQDSEDAAASDVGRTTSTRAALQVAAMGLAERLVPLLSNQQKE
jgi:TolB-like protein